MITFPDAIAVMVAHLTAGLATIGDTAHVCTTIPRQRPARLVRVSQTGGARRNVAKLDQQITLECWAETEAEARKLAGLIYSLAWALDYSVQGVVAYTAGEVGAIAAFPDPDSRYPRYQSTLIVRTNSQET